MTWRTGGNDNENTDTITERVTPHIFPQDYYSKSNRLFIIRVEFQNQRFYQVQQDRESTLITQSMNRTHLFYGRSSFRYIPRITKTTIGTNTDTSRDTDRPKSYIEYDTQRFENDLDTFLVQQLEAFNQENPGVKTEFNKKFNQAFQNIFGLSKEISLQYEDFRTPAEGRPFQFIFKKGSSTFNYDLLSAGEKMVFEILFNLYSRKSVFHDSVVFMDEIDLHLNTSLQYRFLKEITENWIPENCQLWIASHSLGFIDYARNYEKGAIIDFDNLNFDKDFYGEDALRPIDKNDATKSYFKVALGEDLFFNLIESQMQSQTPTIWTEGNNRLYFEKAKELFLPHTNMQFLPKETVNTGKNELVNIFEAFSRKGVNETNFFVFDADAVKEFERLEHKKTNSLIPLLIDRNRNNSLNGIENAFSIEFFLPDFPDRKLYYTSKIDQKTLAKYEQFDKQAFCKYILGRNNPEDFVNFQSLFEQIYNHINKNL